MDANQQPTLEELWRLVQEQQSAIQLQEKVAQRQEEEIRRLRQERQPDKPRTQRRRERRLSRSGLLKAAVAGAAGLTAASVLNRPTVADATSGNMQYGTDNPNMDAMTSVTAGSSFPDGYPVFQANANGEAKNIDGLKGFGSGYYSGVVGYGGNNFSATNQNGCGGVGVIGFAGAANGDSVGTDGAGVAGYARDAPVMVGPKCGVFGSGNGSIPFTPGVWGDSDSYIGVYGTSQSAIGGSFSGGLAPLWLQASHSAGAPSTGNHGMGEVYVDSAGVFWVCIADGNPGTWKSLSSVVSIPNVRVLNTRPSHQIGPYTGPIANNTVLTQTLAGTNGIPSNATGVMGNLTAADATAGCFLALVPHGASHTSVSSVNFPAEAAGTGVANAFTVGLSSDGKVDIYTGNCSSYTVNIIMDITGYIV